MKLAELMRPGVLRNIATATVATRATHQPELSHESQLQQSQCVEVGMESPVAVATVADVAAEVTPTMISKACLLAGMDPGLLPDRLRCDLLAVPDADAPLLAFLIRDDAEWHGWAGGGALKDYAPGGRFYQADL